MPTIRIDDEVMSALEKRARGFVTPNEVLREVLGLKRARLSDSKARSRVGKHEYQLNGSWLGPRDFLMTLESSGHVIASERVQAFDTVLRGSGNGLSNLAKAVAAKLMIPTRSS